MNAQDDRAIVVVGYMPTAYDAAGGIDVEQMADLANSIAAYGIQPAVLGGMGEFYALDRNESRECMEAAVAGAAGMAAVVAAIGFATREATHLAQDAAESGITTLVINPPYYAAPDPSGLAEHVKRVTDASGLQAIVYSSTSYPITDDHLERLVGVPGFRGIKEEAFPVDVTAERIARWGERVNWWGVGELNGMAYVDAGAGTVTSSIANFSPAISLDYTAHRLAQSDSRRPSADAIAAWAKLVGRSVEGAPAALKAMMQESRGWRPKVRLPMSEAGPATRESAKSFVAAFEPLNRELSSGWRERA